MCGKYAGTCADKTCLAECLLNFDANEGIIQMQTRRQSTLQLLAVSSALLGSVLVGCSNAESKISTTSLKEIGGTFECGIMGYNARTYEIGETLPYHVDIEAMNLADKDLQYTYEYQVLTGPGILLAEDKESFVVYGNTERRDFHSDSEWAYGGGINILEQVVIKDINCVVTSVRTEPVSKKEHLNPAVLDASITCTLDESSSSKNYIQFAAAIVATGISEDYDSYNFEYNVYSDSGVFLGSTYADVGLYKKTPEASRDEYAHIENPDGEIPSGVNCEIVDIIFTRHF
jgi:hypothetical protein